MKKKKKNKRREDGRRSACLLAAYRQRACRYTYSEIWNQASTMNNIIELLNYSPPEIQLRAYNVTVLVVYTRWIMIFLTEKKPRALSNEWD